VTNEECEEFSQEHMGEYIVDTVEMNEEDMLTLFDKDNDYLREWPKDQKVAMDEENKLVMTEYNPDNWVVIKMDGDDPHYRVLAGWSGGYLDGDSWRMNSGITRVEDAGDRFNFYGSTGSCYSCGKESYCIRMNNAHIWAQLQELHGDKVKMLDEDTDWLAMDWIIK
jgi:hypothetical protein